MSANFKPGHAGVMTLINGERVNYGAIAERNGNLLYYTGKGLREIHPNTPEALAKVSPELKAKADAEAWDDLKLSGHVAEIPLSQIQSN